MTLAKKSFGQHFLRDQSVLEKIVQAAHIQSTETIVEIGPGTGALTEWLTKVPAKKLVLVEADRDLVPRLEEKYPHAMIVAGDAAQVDFASVVVGDWVLVGNLPYNAGNAIIRQALTSAHRPSRLVVMVQKEVGEKMLAKPGEMSLLSVATQIYADVERVCLVKPGAFVPPPTVDSLVVLLTVKADIPPQAEEVISLAKAAFAHRRKQLHRTLADADIASSEKVKIWLRERALSETIRAQDLSVTDWIELSRFLRV